MSRRGVLLFATLGIVWGIPYLLIKVAVGELDPAMVVLARSGLGGALLLPLALLRRQVLPVLRRWRPLLAYTLVEIVLPWYFLSSAEQRLPSSTAGLLLAAVPIAGVAVALLFGRLERFSAGNWAGVLLGMLGVLALVGLDVAGTDLVGVAELAVVVVGYALGPAILARWMSDLPGLGVVTLSLVLAAVLYLPVVGLSGSWPTAVPSPAVVISILLLAVVCSAAAFLIMFALIAEIGPVRMTTITYVNPAVAILAGAVVLGERITGWTVLGFALVIAGSFLVTRRPPVTPLRPSAEGGRPGRSLSGLRGPLE